MRRHLVLGTLVAIGALSITAQALQQPPAGRGGDGRQGAAQPAPPSADAIQVDKVRDNLYVLRGGGGNTAAFITANGVVLVDSKNPGWGQPLITKLKTVTDKPVTTIINTHTHFDHVSGNVEFPATVDVVTHENTKTLMEQANPVTGLQTGPQRNIFKENNGRGLPKRTFKDKMTLGSGNDRVDLYYFGRAHTGGDAYVVFPSLRVMHAGDTFPNKDLPIMDANNGGSGLAYPDTLSKAAAGVGNVETVITGHAPTTMTLADLREYAEFNRDFVNYVREGKKAGRSIEDVIAGWKTPAKYVGYNPMPVRLKSDVEVVWAELK